ncbi:MAG TPA: diguanylate cyclase [Burkholderiales bacterium]|nr:diguanylate cyclase [Burkholderiales bacterium]
MLTGLSNRNLLHEHLKQALAHASRNDRMIAVVFIDLDRFKWVNDTSAAISLSSLVSSTSKNSRSES